MVYSIPLRCILSFVQNAEKKGLYVLYLNQIDQGCPAFFDQRSSFKATDLPRSIDLGPVHELLGTPDIDE